MNAADTWALSPAAVWARRLRRGPDDAWLRDVMPATLELEPGADCRQSRDTKRPHGHVQCAPECRITLTFAQSRAVSRVQRMRRAASEGTASR
jgi:hypothetical protein